MHILMWSFKKILSITAASKLPGNIVLEAGEANLPKQSVVVVSQVSTVEQAQLGQFIGILSKERVGQILAGMRFLQRLTEHRL